VRESVTIEAVRRFWDANPCGSRLSAQSDRREYFREIAARRYEGERHIFRIARFGDFRNLHVLEIGCGLGTDGVEFARRGARYVGVDLTPAAVALAKEQFALLGLRGDFHVVNVESLPFEDRSFDHVYSFGVIHHTPDPTAVVREIHRVLRPGGSLTVMLYNRSSINYRIEIMLLRRFLRIFLVPSFGPSAVSRMTGIPKSKLETYRTSFEHVGIRDAQRWLSANTDGSGCPLSRVYNAHEAVALFADFGDVRTEVDYFDSSHLSLIGPRLPAGVRVRIGRRFGWHRMVYATNPA
jgi:2-polyprenyl-3-methyl-5-hydroxy-6-metoxy-1,4-benzoquinol methylase